MTVRSTAASPSGQESGGVPRAAASAAPTRQEQVHEGEQEPGAYHYVGPQHHVGPHDHVGPPAGHHVGPVGATRRGDVRVSRNTRTVPAPRRGRRRGRTRPGSASVGMTCLEPHSAGRPRRAGMVSRAANATPPPRPPAPGWPQPGVRGSRPRPGRHETFFLLPGSPLITVAEVSERRPGLRVLDGAWRPALGGPPVVVAVSRYPPSARRHHRNAPALQWAAARAFNASGAPGPHPARRSFASPAPTGVGWPGRRGLG